MRRTNTDLGQYLLAEECDAERVENFVSLGVEIELDIGSERPGRLNFSRSRRWFGGRLGLFQAAGLF